MAVFNHRLTELLKISQLALLGCYELVPAHHWPPSCSPGRNIISFYNEWSVPNLTPLCVWPTPGGYSGRFRDCRNLPSVRTVGLSNSIRSSIKRSKYAQRFREWKLTKSRNRCLLRGLRLHDHCGDEPENVLVGKAGGQEWLLLARPELTDHLLLLLEKSVGLSCVPFSVFKCVATVALKAGLLRYTLLYLKMPFSAYRLPLSFPGITENFWKWETSVSLVEWFLQFLVWWLIPKRYLILVGWIKVEMLEHTCSV